jgi:uncharacterized iron-regulated membrane protein
MSIRNIILKLHLWVGMAAALLILLLAASGTLLVYENEIDRLLNPSSRSPRNPATCPCRSW